MRVSILPAAQSRLLEIWGYTAERWDEDQADAYLRGLTSTMEKLGRQRSRWRSLKDRSIGSGVWFVRHEHHFIFFRELSSDTIGVISVLHAQMDLPRRLRDDEKI